MFAIEKLIGLDCSSSSSSSSSTKAIAAGSTSSATPTNPSSDADPGGQQQASQEQPAGPAVVENPQVWIPSQAPTGVPGWSALQQASYAMNAFALHPAFGGGPMVPVPPHWWLMRTHGAADVLAMGAAGKRALGYSKPVFSVSRLSLHPHF